MASDPSSEGKTEPAERVQSIGPDPEERRLMLRFLNVWEQAINNGAMKHGDCDRVMPRLADFTPAMLKPYKSFSVLIDLQDGYENPVIRHVGIAIQALMRERNGGNHHDFCGKNPHDVPRRSILSRVTDHLFEVIANRAPVGIEADFTDSSGQDIPYRGILTPLSNGGDHINFILAVINWKNGADSKDPDAGLPDPDPATPEPGLASGAALAELHAKIAAMGRSRDVLYGVLADIYGFYLAGEGDPAGYRSLLDGHGIRAQARAPFTAVLKLALGKDYDKTRLTEYAAAMGHAYRQHMDRNGFHHAIRDTPGGIKAMVRADRAARRGTSG